MYLETLRVVVILPSSDVNNGQKILRSIFIAMTLFQNLIFIDDSLDEVGLDDRAQLGAE